MSEPNTGDLLVGDWSQRSCDFQFLQTQVKVWLGIGSRKSNGVSQLTTIEEAQKTLLFVPLVYTAALFNVTRLDQAIGNEVSGLM
jgi:hypothetical protein